MKLNNANGRNGTVTSKKPRLIPAIARLDPQPKPTRKAKQAQHRRIQAWTTKAAGRRDRR